MSETSKKSQIALREEEILKFWQENKIFEKSEALGKKEFIFYDGPPFATGLPHHGHILAGTIKDAIPRYQTMRGKKVFRRWGWDCHGLPLENIVEKELGLKTRKDIETLGIEKFNSAARSAVLRYADDWKRIIPRMGRWVDMENAYRTMDASYTESVWWVFKTLYEKNLIYQGFKGMHVCPRCETTLSNFEVAQGYKDITDISVTVKFELIDEPGTYLLAWTTTPWTLPGNMAAAVNPDIVYVKAEKEGIKYILAKEKLALLGDGVSVLQEYTGSDLVGRSYKPIFDYYRESSLQNKENAWKVYAASYVTALDGTGIVHLAPAYGAEDLDLAQKNKIPIVHHVGMNGAFKKEVVDFAGLQAKPKDDHQSSDVLVIKNLAARNILFAKEKITHSYPHCWRCDTPLLNYASISWFVRVPEIKEKLLKENKKIQWVPGQIGSGRFNNILEDAPDWAISRSRFWGAPLPVWQCAQCESHRIIGSFEELRKYSKTSGNTYFIMRHGEAGSNTAHTLNSDPSVHNHLTENGERGVRESARKLKKENVDLIFTSPIPRARETAAIVREALGISAEQVVVDERLAELSMGIFEGKPIAEKDAFFPSEVEEFAKPIPNGESLGDLRRRVGEFMYEIERTHQDKRILVVSHGDPLWMLLAVSQGATPEESVTVLRKEYPKTGEVRKFDFKPLPHNADYELDVHRPYIDDVTIPCECGAELTRIPDVFDCWFESGSMPYGQFHYPFDTSRFDPKKKKGYPADFIAESLDQTRGWFYSLLVLGVGLFGVSPYKHVITNGLVLAEDGQKMSKKLKNYPDPVDVVNRYGADALRYYLLSSQLIRGEDLNFSERGLDEVAKKILIRLENVLSFYDLYGRETKANAEKSKNILDIWILARLNELVHDVTEGMERYELDSATRPIMLFVDDLSTWYLRRSRERFKGDDESDASFAFATIVYVLKEFSKIMAPFMPFAAERIFLKLRNQKDPESVHLADWPVVKKVNHSLIKDMQEARRIVSLALETRARGSIKVRQPLQSLSIKDQRLCKNTALLKLIKDEVNVKEIHVHHGEEEVTLDTTITPVLRREGLIRDLIREVQDRRKELALVPQDKISVTVTLSRDDLSLLGDVAEDIARETNARKVNIVGGDSPETHIVVEKVQQ